jgi:hypothetical protein
VLAVYGIGCSPHGDVYKASEIDQIATESVNSINNKLKDREITIKDFEVKTIDKTENGIRFSNLSQEDVDAWILSTQSGVEHNLVAVYINTDEPALMNTKIGDKITVCVKLEGVLNSEEVASPNPNIDGDVFQILSFRTVE